MKTLFSIFGIFVLCLTSSCIRKVDPSSPKISFKSGISYLPSGSQIDTGAAFVIGVQISRTTSDLRFLQVVRTTDVDTLHQILSNYVLTGAEGTKVDRDINLRTGVYNHSVHETYTFKVATEEGFVFSQAQNFTVVPHL